jgi:anaerobic magnesium-protoporphyrin IX monomethyl ester cyclase
MGRLDCSPDWLYDKMVDSGCVGMRFGIETFDLDILKRINKGIERVDFRKTLEYLSDSYPDLFLHVTMMKDLPGQTEEIHNNDMKILHDLGFSTENMRRSYQLSACAPFPGTKMYEDLVKEKGELLNDFSRYDGGQSTVMNEVNKQ